MNRRQLLRACSAAGLGALARSAFGDDRSAEKPKTTLGVVLYALGNRVRAARGAGEPALNDPIRFLDSCREFGAGGIQTPLGVREESYCSKLRRNADRYGMFIEGIVGVPHNDAAAESFDAQLRTAGRCGAEVVRTVILPGRRYERFESEEEFREVEKRGVEALERAEPIAARRRVKLAVENHKDQRTGERLAVLRRLSSEWVGACVDTGNSFALLEDPLEVVRAFAPWAMSAHLKDQAVAPCEKGFLFADVRLGAGFLPLAEMVAVLREANPELHFSLETITRDPLLVPCLAESYWPTFPDMPARDPARTLAVVERHARENLTQVSSLTGEERIALEAENVRQSLAFARQALGLVPE